MVDDDIHQRINALKQRRRNDRINQILSAAAEGDLASMKAALKVLLCAAFPFTKCKSLIKVLPLCQNESANVCDDLKRTPLHVAASEGQVRCLNFP